MSKIECTAVNELIDLVQNKPLGRDSEEELLFSAPPAARRPKGTQPPLFSTSAPVPMFPIDAPIYPATPVASYPETPAAQPAYPITPAYVAPVPDNARTNPVKRPLFPVEIASEPTEARATMPVIWTKKPQFEPTPREDDLQTVYVARQKPVNTLFKQLAIPMGILLVSGIAIGGMITFRGEGGTKKTSHVSAPSPFATPALAALPPPVVKVEPIVVAPVPEKPKLVDIRLESTPPGATATLLQNGNTTPLGTTPVDATVDPSKSYDVVFAIDGRPPKVEHLDPSTTQHLEVAFEEPVVAAKPEPVAVATKPSRHHHGAKKSARIAAAAPAHAAKKPAVAKVEAPAPTTTKSKQAAALASLGPATSTGAVGTKPAPGATGTLSISTTPPCAILIDGQNSGLTSPQAAITLPAGHHTVRLIAAPQHINKLVAFDISPKRTTKVVQDYSK